MDDLNKFLSDLFAKLPNLPASVRTALVKIAPYLAVLGLVLSLPVILVWLGFGFFGGRVMMSGIGWGAASGGMAFVFAVISIILLALSIRGLFARQAVGWRFMYYNTLVSAVYAILRLDLFGLIIGTGISLYLLFEVRSYYH